MKNGYMDKFNLISYIIVMTCFLYPSPPLILAEKDINMETQYKPDKRANSGNKPVVTTTPWGQHVQHDLETYKKMEKYVQLNSIEQSWDNSKIDSIIDEKVTSGELVIENPPTRLLTGLWVLDVDGQQRVYLIDTGEGLLLVDPSFDAYTEKVLKQVTELGFTRDDIRWILLTHCHIDHAQSALYWQNLGKEIYIHSNDLNPIRNGNELTAWWLVDNERGYFKPITGPVSTFEDGEAPIELAALLGPETGAFEMDSCKGLEKLTEDHLTRFLEKIPKKLAVNIMRAFWRAGIGFRSSAEK